MGFIHKYLSYIILATIVAAFVFPIVGITVQPYLVYILISVMTLSCLHIDLKHLKQIPSLWWRYLIIFCLIFALPVIVASVFQNYFPKEIFLGLILAAAVPSGVTVVALSDLLDGDPLEALISTTSAHILSPILTPFLVWITTRTIITIDPISMIILISKLVLLPIIIAQILRLVKIDKVLNQQFTSFLNLFLLIMLILGVISPTRDYVFANPFLVLKLAGIMVIIVSLSVFLARLLGKDKTQKNTWMISSSYKNFTLSSVIALQLFGPPAVLASIVYVVVNNLSLIPMQYFANREFSKHKR